MATMLTKTRSTALYATVSRYPALVHFIKYAIVGVLNVAAYFTIFNLLRLAGIHQNVSAAIGFVITSVQSYALNRKWTFKDRQGHSVMKGYALFMFFTLIGLLLNQAAFSLLMIPLGRFGRLGENLALLGAIPVSVMWNFFAYRRWAFTDLEVSSAS